MTQTTPSWFDPGPLPPGAIELYCDPDGGDNANDGLSPGSPKLTISNCLNQLTRGRGDRIHVLRGTTISEGSFNLFVEGASRSAMFVLDTYGTGARPIRYGLGFGMASAPRPFMYITGFEFRPSAIWAPPDLPATYSILNINGHDDIIVEDCVTYGIEQSFVWKGGAIDGEIRGCKFSYNAASAVFVDGVDGLDIEDCVFDTMSTTGSGAAKHYLYVQAGSSQSGISIQRNMFARESGGDYCNEIRAASVWLDNYAYDTFVFYGIGGFGADPYGGLGFSGLDMQWNVCDTIQTGGSIVVVQNLAGATIDNNLWCHQPASGVQFVSMRLKSGGGTGVNNTTFSSNVIADLDSPGITIDPNTSSHSNITIANGQVQISGNREVVRENGTLTAANYISEGNSYFSTATGTNRFEFNASQLDMAGFNTAVGDPDLGGSASTFTQVTYTDSTRTCLLYRDMVESLTPGTSTIADLMADMLAQDPDNWNEDYAVVRIADWVRAGFDMAQREANGGGGPGPGGGAAIAANVLAMTNLNLTRLSGDRVLAFTGTSATLSPKLTDNAKAIRVVSTEDCRIVMGDDAKATSTRLIAGKPEFLSWKPGADLSVIQDTAAGSLYVTELGVATS